MSGAGSEREPDPTRGLVHTDLGRGPAVVLLHGQPGQGDDWSAVAARLAARVRVVVPDRPGYGRTGAGALGVAGNAEVIIDLLDRLGIDRAVIVGHSWGGAVALDLAQRRPDRVAGLVLVGSVGGEGSVDGLDRLLATPILGGTLSLIGVAILRTPLLGRLAAHLAEPTAPDLVADARRRWFRSWRSFVIEQRALVTEMPAIAARLAETTAPSVIVVGERDRVVRPGSQLALAAALPAGRSVVLEGIGHLVPKEAPERLARIILDLATAGGPEGGRSGR